VKDLLKSEVEVKVSARPDGESVTVYLTTQTGAQGVFVTDRQGAREIARDLVDAADWLDTVVPVAS
jgi:hypothetical protein